MSTRPSKRKSNVTKNSFVEGTSTDMEWLMGTVGNLTERFTAIERDMVTKDDLKKELHGSELRNQHYLTVRFEQFRNDFLSARKEQVWQHDDKLKDHGSRIVVLDRRAKLISEKKL